MAEVFVSSISGVLRSAELTNDYSDLSGEELLRLCADLRDTAAWDELIRRFHAAIYAAVLRTGRRYEGFHRGLCDDLAQETYLRLSAHQARALREFAPRQAGSAGCYLRTIAARVTHDYCKRKDFQRIQELPPDAPDPAAPDKTAWLALKAAIGDRLRKHATARDCQIFGLYYFAGMTAKEIAAISAMGLTVKGVEAVLVRLRQLIG
jgi:RNA polymerase sigma factor (sigma-70 family)